MPTLEEALSELEREKGVRERCYERWVKEGRLTAVDARDRMTRLCAAIQLLQPTPAVEQGVSQ